MINAFASKGLDFFLMAHDIDPTSDPEVMLCLRSNQSLQISVGLNVNLQIIVVYV
jgi:hypothetical protein